MSDAHNEHESVIKTPKQLIAAVAAAFIVPVICIVLLVEYVANNDKVGAGSEGQSAEAISARIKPVADDGFTFRDANAPKELLAGSAVYKANCAACHDSGAAGAPKLGDVGGWSARIAKGLESLVANAVNGINAMPAKGGNPDLDDVEVARAVVYMANASGAKFEEPAAKAATVSATEPAADAAAPMQPAAASASDPLESRSQIVKEILPTPVEKPAEEKLSIDAGKKVYAAACQACHTPGIAGAPKLGDKSAWADRLKQGEAVLYDHAINGFQGKAGMMPARGGSAASDAEVKAAVDYMASTVK